MPTKAVRRAWFWGSLAVSAVLTAIFWANGVWGGVLFLLVPFAWTLGLRTSPNIDQREIYIEDHPLRTCSCGFTTRDQKARFCPRCGAPL